MNKNKELLKSIIRESIEEVADEAYERDEAQELNTMKQIQAAAHWLDAHKGANPRDVAQAVTLIKGRIDGLVSAHEQGKEVPGSLESPSNKYREEGMDEVAPPGWEGTVKAMKKHSVGGAKKWAPKKDEGLEEKKAKKKITNPYALAWWMKNKGYTSHK